MVHMRDPWKFVAFPAAAVGGYLLSKTAISTMVGGFTGLSGAVNELIVVAASGLVAGFLVDEVIPTYIENVRSGSGGGDLGGGGDFGDGDMDFGE